MTFDKLLVADQGEVAERVVRTAHALGLRAVAGYADPDLALRAAKDSGAGAIHPGRGRATGGADFARRCEDAGLVFVGPTPEQLELFGARPTARAAADAAGLLLTPGTDVLTSAEEALREADRIGYPVLPKPADGGRGITMSTCRSPGELSAAWDRLRTAPLTGGVYLERFVEHARHVEVPVFGDGEGLVVTFGDRDGSLRHRGRRLLEEAPAPRLPDHVRAQLAAWARDLCAWLDYRSAGTVEFLYDAAREEAYFLEVDTRRGTDHPVTEEVHGVDLLTWALRLARGERGVVRAPGPPRGHAVEARLYGATGAGDTAAHDASPAARVVAHGSDRGEALRRLDAALAGTEARGDDNGDGTGLRRVRAALTDPGFRAATHSTTTLAGYPTEE